MGVLCTHTHISMLSICITLMTNNVEHISTCLLLIWISFWSFNLSILFLYLFFLVIHDNRIDFDIFAQAWDLSYSSQYSSLVDVHSVEIHCGVFKNVHRKFCHSFHCLLPLKKLVSSLIDDFGEFVIWSEYHPIISCSFWTKFSPLCVLIFPPLNKFFLITSVLNFDEV